MGSRVIADAPKSPWEGPESLFAKSRTRRPKSAKLGSPALLQFLTPFAYSPHSASVRKKQCARAFTVVGNPGSMNKNSVN